MADNQNNKKKKKYRMPLRLHFSLVSICTLCFACLFSCGLVIMGVKLLYKGEFTIVVVTLICLFVCCLSMILGGIMLWFGAIHLTKPIGIVNDAVEQVAQGYFDTKIVRKAENRGSFEFTNEIDELSENFNKMVSELNGMDYMRKDFMSNVSHEIKTPVAALTGFSEILIDGGLKEEERQEYLKLVNQESNRLSRLCENMLRMSRLDNQQIVVKKDKVRVDEQIRKCIIMLTEKWTDREMNFELELSEIVVLSDADLLLQVWINLIDNAIKYAPNGSTIWINEIQVNKELRVSIRDEGKGIDAEKQHKIFDKFYQCEESHKKQGNGLGLSIVKRIMELLDGGIECKSKEGEGTTMRVSVPL